VVDWLFLVTCSTGENTLIPNRLLRLTQAILLPAAVMLLGCNNDKSVDPEQVLEQSRETLKEVESELERIKSETEEIASTDNLEAKAKQPNTIYDKRTQGELTLENLMTVELKREAKPDSQESAASVSMPWDIKVSVSNKEEYSGNFAYRCTQKELTRELSARGGVDLRFAGDLAKWREAVRPKSMSRWDAIQMRENGGRPAILAFKAELRTSNEPIDEETEFQEPGDEKVFNQSHSTPEIKAFVASLRYGESGEFDGWQYLKVDLAVPEDSGADE
jgi:hypothetical protein